MRTITSYTSYNFRDKDPIIYLVLQAIRDSGYSRARVCRDSGVSLSCLYAWEYGPTRRPQHATVRALLRAIGRDLVITDSVQRLSSRFPRAVA
jgi:hypothetical protein